MLLTVIVPVYNQEKFIKNALDCLKNQHVHNVEFIVIDNGSTDATNEIILSEVHLDDRFKIISTENRGYGAACNLGLQLSSGTYIAIFEPDDSIPKDFYERLIKEAASHPSAECIKYNGFYEDNAGRITLRFSWDRIFTGYVMQRDILSRFWRSHPCVFNGIYQKDFLIKNDICFCETPSASCQDAMFTVSLYYSDPKILIVDDTKYLYRIHDGQSVRNLSGKFDYIVSNWYIEDKWLKKYGIKDLTYFKYKIFTQMISLYRKEPIYFSLNKFIPHLIQLKVTRYVYNTVGTYKENIRCYAVSFVIFLQRTITKIMKRCI